MINILIALFLLGVFEAMILFIDFDTDAFVEYVSLFKLEKLFKVDEYKLVSKDDPLLSYPEFLSTNHANFFVRMITCPKCLSVWLALLINLPIFIFFSLYYLPIFVLVWLLYIPSSFITSYFGLLMYGVLIRMIKQ
jgi:hypothetical protein